MSVLQEIQNYKLDFVKNQKKNISLLEIIDKCKLHVPEENNLFSKKLINENNKKISIIGELKRSSPSAGNIVNKDIDLTNIAKEYEKNGISCISILTDEKYFDGSNDDLIEVKKHISLPILRKDFIVDEYQIYESKIIGANCILLILSLLDNDTAFLFEKISIELDQKRSKRAFHVGGASAMQHPVDDFWLEWRVIPVGFRACRNNIGMTRKAHHRLTVAFTRPEVVGVSEA